MLCHLRALDYTHELDWCAHLSFLFPAGETYFINSVKNYMHRISDPVLKEQAKRFIHQEAMHTREHARSNHVINQFHTYGSEMEKVAEGLLSFSRAVNPKPTQLATSCALEHFTAMFADSILREQESFRGVADPAFASLWLWHAAEEIEHKAVCFDVYEYICGKGVLSYLHRVAVMAVISLIFGAVVGVGFSIMRYKETRHRKTKCHADDLPTGSSRLALPKLRSLMKASSWDLYWSYYRRSFHPWDHDNSDLLEEWRKGYPGFGLPPTSENAS
jgi:predicted metal-dependent hydrolase